MLRAQFIIAYTLQSLLLLLLLLLLVLVLVLLLLLFIYLFFRHLTQWLLYDLANNPKVQQRVYEEVLSLIGPHGDFTPESFAKLQYIKACVKESMR